MISSKKILLFSAITMGLITEFCKASILISSQTPKEKIYRMNLEIFKHIDRYHSVFRRAEASEIYKEINVKSDFNFFARDDNVNEFKNYMNFIGTSGRLFNNLTLSYSILYTKYTAAFYAMNLLNIYKIKKKEFESWNSDDLLKIYNYDKEALLKIYLKMSQYFAWYAFTGNDALQTVIMKRLSEKNQKNQCAESEYKIFEKSFNEFLREVNKEIFKDLKPSDISTNENFEAENFWGGIYQKSAEDIKNINRYFTALFLGTPKDELTKSEFISTVHKEPFIVNFVSDLSVMKGRDIDETYPNFDYNNKKEIYEANVVNVMAVIEHEEMKSIPEAFDELSKAQKNEKYVVLQRSTQEKNYTCMVLKFMDHETLKPKEKKKITNTEE